MLSFFVRVTQAASLALTCSAAVAADQYGALSYSRARDTYSVALNQASREAAERAAMTSCRRLGPDCWSSVWVQNGCVSIAIGGGRGYGSGWGSTRASAEDEALSVCFSHAQGCYVRHTACTGE